MLEFTAKNSGKSVKIIPAPFKDAIRLKKEVLKCLNQAGIIKELKLETKKNSEVTDVFSSLSNLLITMDTSDSFETAIFDCLKVCIYDNTHSITLQLFNDKPELQEDYYEIITKCCEVNLRPFFKSLTSELSSRFGQLGTEYLQSETELTENS